MDHLSHEELQRIANWEPYRDDWPINRNTQTTEEILELYVRPILECLRTIDEVQLHIAHDDDLGNYYEIIIYTEDSNRTYSRAIVVYLSLCAPIAVVGDLYHHFDQESNFREIHEMKPERAGNIKNRILTKIYPLVANCLENFGIRILNRQEITKRINPAEYDQMEHSLNYGDQVFHALFQWSD